MSVGSVSNSDNFFNKYNAYTKDGSLSTNEYQELKKLYMEENNATEEEFNHDIAPALDQFILGSDVSDGAKDIISQAFKDGKLSFQEYQAIKKYYMDTLNISSETFESALDYIIRKDIINYLRENEDQEVDISDFTPKNISIQEALENSIAKAIIRDLANDIVKMRTESDFSEYTYRVLKAESQKTDVDAQKV